MAFKRTFIKVRRGILEAKHRHKLSEAWQLYLFMLDLVNWETGIIYEWRDADAADELEMPLSTLRNQRRRLENEGYISTTQKQHYLQIAVNKWENPKEKNGKAAQGNSQGDNEGYNEGDSALIPWDNEGDNHGDNQGDSEGDNQGDSNLTPVHINSDLQTFRPSEKQKSNKVTPSSSGANPDVVFAMNVYLKITTQLTIPHQYRDGVIETISRMREKYKTEEEMVNYLKPFFEAWKNRRNGNGSFYSVINCTWLTDWAVGGIIPEPGAEKKSTQEKNKEVIRRFIDKKQKEVAHG